ncbi:MAG: hypothetical protein LEGION0398_MBIBDBAK_00358 [Legionellaceae bacterium]
MTNPTKNSDPQVKETLTIDQLAEEKLSFLDQLSKQIDNLSVSENSNNKPFKTPTTMNQTDIKNFAEILKDLKNNWSRSRSVMDVSEKQNKVLEKLSELAETGEDFYALYQFASKDSDLKTVSYSYLLMAASKGHDAAMSAVADYALSGLYSPKENSIIWALNYIRYLQDIVIPDLYEKALNDENAKNDLSTRTRGLDKLCARLDKDGEFANGKQIPQENTTDFKTLVDSICKRLEKKTSTVNFSLSNNIFSNLVLVKNLYSVIDSIQDYANETLSKDKKTEANKLVS